MNRFSDIFKENFIIKKAKNERIQVQYYLKSDISKESSNYFVKISEEFRIEINIFLDNLTNENIHKYNTKLKNIL